MTIARDMHRIVKHAARLHYPAVTSDFAQQQAAVRRVVWVTLWLNVAVAASKILYGLFANALSIRADGFHSTTDAVNNVAALVVLRMASQPPDPGHPYGHQKFEILASLGVGLVLLAMAYDVAREAAGRLLTNAVLPQIDARAFAVLAATLAVNIFVARYEKQQGERLKSSFLLSDASHTRADVLVTCAVMFAALVIRLGFPIADLIAAVFVAGFIAWAGIKVLRQNIGYVADAAQLETDHIEELVVAVPGVASTHKIRTRGVPGSIYVDLHIQIAPHLNVVEAHRVTHWVIDAIKQGIDGVTDVTVHTEPARPDQRWPPLPWERDDAKKA
jgi:cation diffusion facilitator family transporter